MGFRFVPTADTDFWRGLDANQRLPEKSSIAIPPNADVVFTKLGVNDAAERHGSSADVIGEAIVARVLRNGIVEERFHRGRLVGKSDLPDKYAAKYKVRILFRPRSKSVIDAVRLKLFRKRKFKDNGTTWLWSPLSIVTGNDKADLLVEGTVTPVQPGDGRRTSLLGPKRNPPTRRGGRPTKKKAISRRPVKKRRQTKRTRKSTRK
jgi:hypothetical protein